MPDSATGAASPSPLYQQVKSLILRGLQSGDWKPGEAIPPETELAVRYRVSQGTVRKAIDELSAENRLVRRQGKGTFVATHAEEHQQYRFLRLTPDVGERARLRRRFLDCRRMRPPPEVARALQLERGENAVQVRRLLLQADTPVVLDDIWLPGSMFRGLTEETLASYRGPMYGLFESDFGVSMIRADEKIRAVAAAPEEAELLGVAAGSPLLLVERLAFTYGERPVEWRRGLYDTSQHHYRNELS